MIFFALIIMICVRCFTHKFDQIILYINYYRFSINLVFAANIYWKMKFWCCPGVGHLHPIFKPHRGAFAAFPKHNDKYLINAWGWGEGDGQACNIID